MEPTTIDNRSRIFKDELSENIAPGSSLAIAAPQFSMYAWRELREKSEDLNRSLFLDGLDEGDIANEWTRFKELTSWDMLNDFQYDVLLAAINKNSTCAGCPLVGSAGLGKMFTALAVIVIECRIKTLRKEMAVFARKQDKEKEISKRNAFFGQLKAAKRELANYGD